MNTKKISKLFLFISLFLNFNSISCQEKLTKKDKIKIAATLVGATAIAGGTGYFYWNHKKNKSKKKANPFEEQKTKTEKKQKTKEHKNKTSDFKEKNKQKIKNIETKKNKPKKITVENNEKEKVIEKQEEKKQKTVPQEDQVQKEKIKTSRNLLRTLRSGGRFEDIKNLVKKGALLNLVYKLSDYRLTNKKYTLAEIVMESNRYSPTMKSKIINLFIENGYKRFEIDFLDYVSLPNYNVEYADSLLKYFDDINATYQNGNDMLQQYLTSKKHIDLKVLELLLKNGLNPNNKDVYKRDTLYILLNKFTNANSNTILNAIKLLLSHGAIVDIVHQVNFFLILTPQNVKNGEGIVKLLLSYSPLKSLDDLGKFVWFKSEIKKLLSRGIFSLEIIKSICESLTELDYKNELKSNLLINLFDPKIELDKLDSEQLEERNKTIKYLIESCTNFFIEKNKYNNNVLHFCFKNINEPFHTNFIKFLVKNDCINKSHLNSKNSDGKTPFELIENQELRIEASKCINICLITNSMLKSIREKKKQLESSD